MSVSTLRELQENWQVVRPAGFRRVPVAQPTVHDWPGASRPLDLQSEVFPTKCRGLKLGRTQAADGKQK